MEREKVKTEWLYQCGLRDFGTGEYGQLDKVALATLVTAMMVHRFDEEGCSRETVN